MHQVSAKLLSDKLKELQVLQILLNWIENNLNSSTCLLNCEYSLKEKRFNSIEDYHANIETVLNTLRKKISENVSKSGNFVGTNAFS